MGTILEASWMHRPWLTVFLYKYQYFTEWDQISPFSGVAKEILCRRCGGALIPTEFSTAWIDICQDFQGYTVRS